MNLIAAPRVAGLPAGTGPKDWMASVANLEPKTKGAVHWPCSAIRASRYSKTAQVMMMVVSQYLAALASPCWMSSTCGEIKNLHGAFVLNHRVDLYTIDAAPVRCRGDAHSTSRARPRRRRERFVKNYEVRPSNRLIPTLSSTSSLSLPASGRVSRRAARASSSKATAPGCVAMAMAWTRSRRAARSLLTL